VKIEVFIKVLNLFKRKKQPKEVHKYEEVLYDFFNYFDNGLDYELDSESFSGFGEGGE
jgi:hypothetical protein